MSSRNSRRQHEKRKAKEKSSKATPSAISPHQPQSSEGQGKHLQSATVRRRRSLGEILASNSAIVLVGFLAAIVTLVGVPLAFWGSPLFLDPELHAATDAYSSPFTVINKSGWYSMTDVRFTCFQGPVQYVNPNIHVGYNVSSRPIDARFPILPNGHETFPCTGFMDFGAAISGQMILHITYTTRWHSHILREPRTVMAVETYEQGKWIDGNII